MKESNKIVKDSPNGVGALNAMKYNTNETIQIPPELIAGYILLRSPADKFKFNVLAVDAEGDFLFVVASDLSFEQASAMVEVVNQEYYPVAPTPTESVFIEIGGESKVYNITSK